MSSWILLGLLIALAAAIAFLVRLAACRRLALKTAEDELEITHTPDGAAVALLRYRPRTAALEPPVVLCHGLGATRFNLDFGEQSLARHLAQRGHDVFVLELRGGPLARQHAPRSPGRRVDFDDHLLRDIPAALDTVTRITGAAKVHWVGHSMGGMLAYAMLGGEAGRRLAGVVAVGSPATWAHHRKRLFIITRIGLWLTPFGIPAKMLAELAAPLAGWVTLPGMDSFANAANMTGQSIRRALYNVVGDVSRGHLEQLGCWVLERSFCSRDGSVDYREGLGRAEAPVLLVAGSRDRLAPPAAVREVCDQLGSHDRTLVVVGRDSGAGEEYGHGDLLLGRNVGQEVFPLIAGWLAERSRPARTQVARGKPSSSRG